jgi:hypothetical protein
MTDREIPWFKLGAAAMLLTVVVGIVLVVHGSQQLAAEIQPIAWHRQPCAHCQMLIDDPAYAAQLITEEGDVFAFDDPGCALRYLDEHHPSLHRLWFHHSISDRWLAVEEVAFTTDASTPMGFGLAAVDRGASGSLDLEAATARARAHAAASRELP